VAIVAVLYEERTLGSRGGMVSVTWCWCGLRRLKEEIVGRVGGWCHSFERPWHGACPTLDADRIPPGVTSNIVPTIRSKFTQDCTGVTPRIRYLLLFCTRVKHIPSKGLHHIAQVAEAQRNNSDLRSVSTELVHRALLSSTTNTAIAATLSYHPQLSARCLCQHTSHLTSRV
jgi:hypothetical protein